MSRTKLSAVSMVYQLATMYSLQPSIDSEKKGKKAALALIDRSNLIAQKPPLKNPSPAIHDWKSLVYDFRKGIKCPRTISEFVDAGTLGLRYIDAGCALAAAQVLISHFQRIPQHEQVASKTEVGLFRSGCISHFRSDNATNFCRLVPYCIWIMKLTKSVVGMVAGGRL